MTAIEFETLVRGDVVESKSGNAYAVVGRAPLPSTFSRRLQPVFKTEGGEWRERNTIRGRCAKRWLDADAAANWALVQKNGAPRI